MFKIFHFLQKLRFLNYFFLFLKKYHLNIKYIIKYYFYLNAFFSRKKFIVSVVTQLYGPFFPDVDNMQRPHFFHHKKYGESYRVIVFELLYFFFKEYNSRALLFRKFFVPFFDDYHNFFRYLSCVEKLLLEFRKLCISRFIVCNSEMTFNPITWRIICMVLLIQFRLLILECFFPSLRLFKENLQNIRIKDSILKRN